MKLNATAEMIPVTWPEFSRLHPFVPAEQAKGYHLLTQQLEAWLAEITGFAAVSLQPNAGSQGEYAGLMVIRAYQDQRGEDQRNVCLIPVSAHGTNPASAVIAGMQVIPVACDNDGNIDLQDLETKCEKYQDSLAAFMVTYPSTHGVFEETIRQVCATVHQPWRTSLYGWCKYECHGWDWFSRGILAPMFATSICIKPFASPTVAEGQGWAPSPWLHIWFPFYPITRWFPMKSLRVLVLSRPLRMAARIFFRFLGRSFS